MDKEKFAKQITGREYPFALTIDEVKAAKAAGLVVVYNSYDDVVKFEGAINTEIDIEKTQDESIYLHDGKVAQPCGCGEKACGICSSTLINANIKTEAIKNNTTIRMIEHDGSAWWYETEIEHVCFLVIDYCHGIVFDIKELSSV